MAIDMSKFNKKQEEAILFGVDEDLLVSAGAGSGKTKVIAERVYRLVEEGLVVPEKLLVLTFTNNAAFEMRSRILDRFGKGNPFYERLLSSHIQSFDSFNAYIARQFAPVLKIPSSFQILPESIAEEMKSQYEQEALNEAYSNSEERKIIGDLLGKNGFKSDRQIEIGRAHV